MNPETKIIIYDMPQALRNGMYPVIKDAKDEAINDGDVTSEVGEPVNVKLRATFKDNLRAYQLRAPRKLKIPGHMFGKMELGDAFSAMVPRAVSIPVIQTSLTLQPTVTARQFKLIDMYRYFNADVYWRVFIPCPIGTSVLLEAYAPEIDSRTKTRGVRWRPAGKSCIDFYLPWSSDITMGRVSTPRPGQSGGALTIRTVEDNTTESVNVPLVMTVWCCVVNVKCTGLKPDTEAVPLPGLNSAPLAITALEEITQHGDGDSIEVNVEGGANIAEQDAVDELPAESRAPPVEKQVKKTKVPKRAAASKNQAGLPGAIWFEAHVITLTSADLMNWVNVSINPYTLNIPGENISKPYRRNYWVAGSTIAGYARTLEVRMIIPRSPMISGLVEVCDSLNDSSRYWVEFGQTVDFNVIPHRHSGTVDQPRPRYANNRYLRTNNALTDFKYRLVAFNRTADVADVKIRVLIKLGSVFFNVNTKPRPTASAGLFLEHFDRFIQKKEEQESGECGDIILEEIEQHSGQDTLATMIRRVLDTYAGEVSDTMCENDLDAPVDDAEGDNVENTDDVAPPVAELYGGELNAGGADNEHLEQDEFVTEIWRGSLPVGDTIAVPLMYPVIEDLSGTGGPSVIAEKFERHAHVVPGSLGSFGPKIGNYVINTRLPTNVAGHIAHVSLPGDMMDEIFAAALGIGSILALATSGLQAVGGPAISGMLQAGRDVLGTVAGIGGKLLGTLTGGSNPAANPVSLAGPVEVSRFINFLKPLATNESLDPTFGAALINARDFFSGDMSPMTQVPASVWANMADSLVERALQDRGVMPSTTMENVLRLPYSDWSSLAMRFLEHKNTFVEDSKENVSFRKFMMVIQKKGGLTSTTSISLTEIREQSLINEREFLYEAAKLNMNFFSEP